MFCSLCLVHARGRPLGLCVCDFNENICFVAKPLQIARFSPKLVCSIFLLLLLNADFSECVIFSRYGSAFVFLAAVTKQTIFWPRAWGSARSGNLHAWQNQRHSVCLLDATPNYFGVLMWAKQTDRRCRDNQEARREEHDSRLQKRGKSAATGIGNIGNSS